MEERATTSKKPLHSSPLPTPRPLTPPDMEADTSCSEQPRSAAVDVRDDTLFDSTYSSGSSLDAASDQALGTRDAWPPSPSPSPDLSPTHSVQKKGRVSPSASRGFGSIQSSPDSRPYTPTKTSVQRHGPQYPFTPDSMRVPIKRSITFDAASSLPQTPWASPPSADFTRASPVQHALFSCLNNLERLISTNQPGPTQMEYIIGQFEAMTSYLSAPEAQSKQLDEHLFSELEKVEGVDKSQRLTKEEAEAYVAEVGAFIQGVRVHAAELQTRLDETKQLNEIYVDIISDLRQELRTTRDTVAQLQQKLDRQGEPRTVRHHKVFVKVDQPKRSGFWSSFVEALDEFGAMLNDW
ncbi:uncharacterized protein EI97DRAFT_436586 [Westerdykella ornata]|uniref:Uncharacterized protein n=1 Tax=Westerdykella ornata TaxID=318751 RepID=A0A6A6J8C9_WESOR|nr:uncharacterized protein EI97DRAFT_436586 [Westerdykella ornata]KAF2272810.1 hypothetical protein EI97DRAFT_436586 [Westerdykella ornata]